MRVCKFAAHLDAVGKKRPVLALYDVTGLQRLGEARPTRAGIVFVQGAEQGLAGHNVHIDTRLLVIPVFVLER